MENKKEIGKLYLGSILLFMLILPLFCIGIEAWKSNGPFSIFDAGGKWFIFWSCGIRLFIAGLRQVINPAFTAKDIFNINDASSHVIVKELGFANLCFGVIGILSLFQPSWRIVSAIASGLYYGLAGINHLFKKPASPNEKLAMVSDIFIFLLLTFYAIHAW